jgi:cytochrome bd-type quinol oxidase subunit 2
MSEVAVRTEPDGRRAVFDGRRAFLAAGSAALAEAGLLFLPITGFLGGAGPLTTPWVFVPLFVLVVGLGAASPRPGIVPPAVGATWLVAAVVQAFAFGPTDLSDVLTALLLALALALRTSTLALRDWRDPIRLSFGLEAIAVLVETGFARRAGWSVEMPWVVAGFFTGSLVSRAVCVWSGRTVEGGAPNRWPTVTVAWLGAVGLGMGLAVAVGARGGLLRLSGGAVIPAAIAVVLLVAFAMTEKGGEVRKRPAEKGERWLVAAVFGLIFLDIALLIIFGRRNPRRVKDTLGFFRDPRGQQPYDLGFRIFAAALAAVLVLAAYRLIHERVRRGGWRGFGPAQPPGVAGPAEPFARAPLFGRAPRRELPAATIRRWYAEALLVLEDRGLLRPPDVTPGEFEGDVVRAFPACREGFHLLTLAYQEVRYGNRELDRRNLEALASHRTAVIQAFRTSERADEEVSAGSSE